MVYAHPGTIPGWSEYLWILGYSGKGVVCGVCPSRDDPGMVRVSLELKNSMPFYGVTGHSGHVTKLML